MYEDDKNKTDDRDKIDEPMESLDEPEEIKFPSKSDEEKSKEEIEKENGSSQFRYDTPFNGGSAHDKAGIKAAKEGKWITEERHYQEAREEVKEELGQD